MASYTVTNSIDIRKINAIIINLFDDVQLRKILQYASTTFLDMRRRQPD